jgi:hypothetical protein
MRRAARQGFDAESACARKQIEHARALDRIVMTMHQDIEDAFAQPIGRWPHGLR